MRGAALSSRASIGERVIEVVVRLPNHQATDGCTNCMSSSKSTLSARARRSRPIGANSMPKSLRRSSPAAPSPKRVRPSGEAARSLDSTSSVTARVTPLSVSRRSWRAPRPLVAGRGACRLDRQPQPACRRHRQPHNGHHVHHIARRPVHEVAVRYIFVIGKLLQHTLLRR
jgi:hypothetical protein